MCTLALSIVGGLSGGFLVKYGCAQKVSALFRDDDHFHEVLHDYPASFLQGCDETIRYGKEALYRLQDGIVNILPENEAKSPHIRWLVDNVWFKYAPVNQNKLSKTEVLKFINTFLDDNGDNIEDDPYLPSANNLLEGAVFDALFRRLDKEEKGKVDR